MSFHLRRIGYNILKNNKNINKNIIPHYTKSFSYLNNSYKAFYSSENYPQKPVHSGKNDNPMARLPHAHVPLESETHYQSHEFLGGDPVDKDGKRIPEGWETITFVGTIIGVILLGVGWYFQPDTDINTWARSEALARIRAELRGEEIQFGEYYNEKHENR